MATTHPYRTLLKLEVESIQAFITEGMLLTDMRGASALLDEANRVGVPHLIEKSFHDAVKVLRSSGGVTVLGVRHEAPSETEDTVIRKIRGYFREHVPGATLQIAQIDCDDELEVPDLIRHLNYKSSFQQNDRPSCSTDAVLLESLTAFCRSCGRRPAVTTRPDGETKELVCRVCARKSKNSKLVRRGKIVSSVLSRFARHVADHSAWQDVDVLKNLPDDFDHLASVAPSKDLALILADGNRLGQTLRHLKSFEAYEEFSKGIAEIVEQSLFDALADYLPRQPQRNQNEEAQQKTAPALPWEVLYLGGDDVLVITAADIALRLTQQLMRYVEERAVPLFEKLNLTAQRSTLTMAAGVAMAPAHYPFAAFYRLTKELESSAKEKAYAYLEDYQQEVSTIDYHRLTSSGQTTLKFIRGKELRPLRKGSKEAVSLTMRPFTLATLEEVLNTVQAWSTAEGKARLPRSKVHYLRERLFESSAEAMFAWAHVVGRAQPEERTVWQELAHLSEGTSEEGAYRMPWITFSGTDDKTQRATFLLDVIDLYVLMPKKKRSS